MTLDASWPPDSRRRTRKPKKATKQTAARKRESERKQAIWLKKHERQQRIEAGMAKHAARTVPPLPETFFPRFECECGAVVHHVTSLASHRLAHQEDR
jgi:hypothetical protein